MVTNSNKLQGQALGTCTLERLIGRGGMGVVYLAQQSRPRRTVAVKVLMPSMVFEQKSRSEFLTRFRREADAIAALDHVNIMPIYEYGEQEDLAYLVMPYVTGGTLRQFMEKRGVLPPNEVVPIIAQAAAALDCAHAQGIIHRDLKPGNILFHADGRVLLADFGLAKVLKDVQEHDSNGQSALTSAGTIIGTPEYLSPEQGMGKEVDPRTDVYSLGIVLFQMLSGRVPFIGASPVAIAIKHTLEEPPSLSQINTSIPQSVEAVIMKAIAKKPEQRYNSAGELAQALQTAIAEAHVTQMLSDIAIGPMDVATLASEPEPVEDPIDEAATLATTPEPEMLKGHKGEMEVVTLASEDVIAETPTLLYHEDFHSDATEAAPPIVVPDPVMPVQPPPVPAHAAATVASPIVERPAKPVAVPPDRSYQPAVPRKRFQSMGMMLLGSILTLLLIAGSLVAYVHFQPPAKPTGHLTPTPQASSTPIARTPTPLPNPLVPVGSLLYGTTHPGPGAQCDTQGGQWSSSSGIKVTCGTNGTDMANTGGSIAGMILKTLASGKQIPNSYVLQVQATVNPTSHGDFGVFFRHQTDAPLGTFAFIVNTDNTWKANVYDSRTGGVNTLVGLPVQGKVEGTITIDIIVQGSSFTFYINHVVQGYADSGLYTGGTLGLAADAGTDVSFKNLAIYALPA